MTSTALLTDHYELTMLQAALATGTAHRRSVFELFPRRLPDGRRYGVVAGVGRALASLRDFCFGEEEIDFLRREQVVDEPVTDDLTQLATPWVTIVWNDPVNLMSYVTFVFTNYFGYSKKKAEKLMLEVHNDGRSVVSTGSREEMERDVQAMHEYGLWATMQKSDAP